MTPLQLARIVEWAGTLHSRKRLQKVVYLLQTLRCPIEAEYTLHHYGPYSADVARLTDQMTQAGLLIETAEPGPGGPQYSYRLSETSKAQIQALHERPGFQDDILAFKEVTRRLLKYNPRELEIASTVVYFRRQGDALDAATEHTAAFKSIDPEGELMGRALEIVGSLLQ